MADIHWETRNYLAGPTWWCGQCNATAAGNLQEIQQAAIDHECP